LPSWQANYNREKTKMTWTDIALDKAKAIIAQEPELIKQTYRGTTFGELATKSGLYFSFGDIAHFIHSSFRISLSIREMKGGAGIACFEDLAKRLRLYLIAELKLVVEMQAPYGGVRCRFNTVEPDYNFITDFLELFKELDQLEGRLAEIRKSEGGFYQ
jgi:hypothetical protein